MPSYPVTLAYDLGAADQVRTIYFHNPGQDSPDSNALFIEFDEVIGHGRDIDWDSLANVNWEGDVEYPIRSLFKGDILPGVAAMPKHLPSALLVYTSGSERPWHEVFNPKVDATFENVSQDDERPIGWTRSDEIRYLLESAYQDERERRLQGDSRNTPPWIEKRQDLFADPADEEWQSIGSFVTAEALPLAVCAATIKQSADDFKLINEENLSDKEFIDRCYEKRVSNEKRMTFRALLNEAGWLWPVTLKLTVDLAKFKDTRLLRNLYSLAAMVIKEPIPEASYRDPSDSQIRRERTLIFDLRASVKPATGDFEGASTVANQLVDVIGRQKGIPEKSAYRVFSEFSHWHKRGFLRRLDFTLRRFDVEGILLYDALSDGERMYLGRMSLLHFMQGLQDALIIFDEPETHFNDYWKRQIVDILDDSLRNATHEILISTHSSIALTDVFAEEIVLLDRQNGETVVLDVTTPTFGADPSEVMMYLFSAPDSIGKRALEYLEKQLERDWKSEELEELEYLIRQVGPGYHRSELRTIWREIRRALQS